MSIENIVATKVAEDRMYLLIRLLKTQSIHDCKNEFAQISQVNIEIENLQKIYTIWFSNRTKPPTITIKELRRWGWWKEIEDKIKKGAADDIAKFIYHYWKKRENL